PGRLRNPSLLYYQAALFGLAPARDRPCRTTSARPLLESSGRAGGRTLWDSFCYAASAGSANSSTAAGSVVVAEEGRRMAATTAPSRATPAEAMRVMSMP